MGFLFTQIQLFLVIYSEPSVLFLDIFAPLLLGIHTYFPPLPKPKKPLLISSLLSTRPNIFLATPKHWKQLLDRIDQAYNNSNSFTKLVIAFESLLSSVTGDKENGREKSVFERIRGVMGLDNVKVLACLRGKKEVVDEELKRRLQRVGVHLLEPP